MKRIPKKILVLIIAKISKPLEIFDANNCVTKRTENMKINIFSMEKYPNDEEIIKNQNESPAVTARDLNLGEEEFILDRINECN